MYSINNKDFAIKIAVMYIIERYGEAISDDIMTNIAIEVCDINYFNLKKCQYELEQTGFIHKFSSDGEEMYMLTEKGLSALEAFRSKLAYTLRAEIAEKIVNYLPENYNKSAFECFVMPINDVENEVVISYKEGKTDILSMKIYAGSEQQAKELAKAVKLNKNKVFEDIYKYFAKLDEASENE